MDFYKAVFQKAQEHADSCEECWSPILDVQGDESTISESCKLGMALLFELGNAETIKIMVSDLEFEAYEKQKGQTA